MLACYPFLLLLDNYICVITIFRNKWSFRGFSLCSSNIIFNRYSCEGWSHNFQFLQQNDRLIYRLNHIKKCIEILWMTMNLIRHARSGWSWCLPQDSHSVQSYLELCSLAGDWNILNNFYSIKNFCKFRLRFVYWFRSKFFSIAEFLFSFQGQRLAGPKNYCNTQISKSDIF